MFMLDKFSFIFFKAILHILKKIMLLNRIMSVSRADRDIEDRTGQESFESILKKILLLLLQMGLGRQIAFLRFYKRV